MEYTIDNFKQMFLNNGDGIYVLYYDCLSRDAAYIYVIMDGKIIKSCQQFCFSTRDYYNGGSEIGIVPTLRAYEKDYPQLNLYMPNIGWHTFPQAWKEVDMEISYLRDKFHFDNLIVLKV